MAESYEKWLKDVQTALRSINMPFDDWQKLWRFDFQREFNAGVKADDAAVKGQPLLVARAEQVAEAGLPKDPGLLASVWASGRVPARFIGSHFRPTYAPGDYVKVEFPDKTTGISEWMWVRVSRCDDQKQLVFGTLDSEPFNDYDGQIGLGSELAVSFSPIREHRKPTCCGTSGNMARTMAVWILRRLRSQSAQIDWQSSSARVSRAW